MAKIGVEIVQSSCTYCIRDGTTCEKKVGNLYLADLNQILSFLHFCSQKYGFWECNTDVSLQSSHKVKRKKKPVLPFLWPSVIFYSTFFRESSNYYERGKTTNCTFIVVACLKKDWLGATCGQLLPVISSLPKKCSCKASSFQTMRVQFF